MEVSWQLYTPDAQWIGNWVGFKADMEAAEKRISPPETKPDSQTVIINLPSYLMVLLLLNTLLCLVCNVSVVSALHIVYLCLNVMNPVSLSSMLS
jgi:hypothetical protein